MMGISIPNSARPIPGYDAGYYITPAGVIYSTKWGGVTIKDPYDGQRGPRVCLYRNNKRTRRYVDDLVELTFGSAASVKSDGHLVEDVRAEYAGHPEVEAWASDVLGEQHAA